MQAASHERESGAFDVIDGMRVAVYRVNDGLFVNASGLEFPINSLKARLRRGWLRSRLVLERGTDVVADLRYPGRWVEIPHRMDAYAYQDDELDFGLFLAGGINERERWSGLLSDSETLPN